VGNYEIDDTGRGGGGVGERGITSLIGGRCISSVIGDGSLTTVGKAGYLRGGMQGKSTTAMIVVWGSHRTRVRMQGNSTTAVIVAQEPAHMGSRLSQAAERRHQENVAGRAGRRTKSIVAQKNCPRFVLFSCRRYMTSGKLANHAVVVA
jgi:hypothetical protein